MDNETAERHDVTRLLAAWDHLLFTLGDAETAERSEPLQAASSSIPVTILSGFLGAGKTTLLCQLLDAADVGILAIVNDLGAVNIDAEKIRARTDEVVTLENGCACCVLGSDLGRLLRETSRRSDAPDAIVIECSGIADPYGLAQTVAIADGVALDGVITVVDAITWKQRATGTETGALFKRQLASANLVVVRSKEEAKADAVWLRDQLGRSAPGSPIVFLEDLQQRKDMLANVLLGAATLGAHPPIPAVEHQTDAFAAEVVSWDVPVEAAAFYDLLESIPESVYRLKGWLRLADEAGERHVELQGTGTRWRTTETDSSTDTDHIVVIGERQTQSFIRFVERLRALSSNHL